MDDSYFKDSFYYSCSLVADREQLDSTFFQLIKSCESRNQNECHKKMIAKIQTHLDTNFKDEPLIDVTVLGIIGMNQGSVWASLNVTYHCEPVKIFKTKCEFPFITLI